VPGATDALNPLEGEAGAVGHLAGGGGERLAEKPVQQADLARFALDAC
jgi:hypothetical protein